MAEPNNNLPATPPEAEQLEVADDTSPKPADDSKPTQTTASPAKNTEGNAAPDLVKAKNPVFKSFSDAKYLYLGIFILVVVIGGGIILAAIKWGQAPAATSNVTHKLTADQLAALASNTTVVGDATSTLNVQSNAVFDGQVLMKQGLNVAGGVQVGGSLTVPSVNVGNSGTFGQIQINKTLSVTGDGVIQGQLTVQKGLTVAGSSSITTLSVSQLNVSGLQLSGDLSINRHIIVAGGTPNKTNGTALGTGGTTSISGGDTAGTVSINTGNTPPAGCFVTLNFAQKYGTVPHVIISPSSSAAGSLSYYADRTVSGFSICSAGVPAAASSYIFDYMVIQ